MVEAGRRANKRQGANCILSSHSALRVGPASAPHERPPIDVSERAASQPREILHARNDARHHDDARGAPRVARARLREGAPGPRGEADENGNVFYAAYFRDRDGNKLNAFCMVPQG